MILSAEQQAAVDANGHVMVTACPGSGKTRVLTFRVLRAISELTGSKKKIVALTYTNRAADEIQHRLDQANVSTDNLWAGTIHSFALEWILKPYAPYSERTRLGFQVADEHYTSRLLDELRESVGDEYLRVRTGWSRDGQNPNVGVANGVFVSYKEDLRSKLLLDYDDVLFIAYSILRENPEICQTLSAVFPLICVDEVQDVQDMQYAILSQIVRNGDGKTSMFFVGDENQSIYESLGALTKNSAQIAEEFGVPKILHLRLSENYRSTQRLVDYYTNFRPGAGKITSVASHAPELGQIRFLNQTVSKDEIAKSIAEIITESLQAGVAMSDICVLAPRWYFVAPLARGLMEYLPEADFDAPELSPLHSSRDNVWFKLGRLFLTGARHGRDRTRQRWANDFISSFERLAKIELPEQLRESRGLLRCLNSIKSDKTEGVEFLRDAFSQFLKTAGLHIYSHTELLASQNAFFEKAEHRLKSTSTGVPTSVVALRKLFRSPAGIVINTCHGVKGEEFHTVIASGLLHGLIPHWDEIFSDENHATEQASKLLYVICSRAKTNLYLIAESGRTTKSKNAYQTAKKLAQVKFKYDN